MVYSLVLLFSNIKPVNLYLSDFDEQPLTGLRSEATPCDSPHNAGITILEIFFYPIC